MGYMKIDNLYKNTDIMMFRECYALEKIHGTSSHIRWTGSEVGLHSGGIKHEKFTEMISREYPGLAGRFREVFGDEVGITVYGEAYGGKCQRMSETYGKDLRFVAFEVQVGEIYLSVDDAADVVDKLGLEFVHYAKGPATLEWINSQRDLPSTQAKRNGIEGEKMSEGVVLRPPIEIQKSNGRRIIAKHKNEDFRETKTPRKVTDEDLAVLKEAEAIAEEWVTEMRLTHILDKIDAKGIEDTGKVIRAMVQDVETEGQGEIEWSKAARKAVGKRAAALYKQRVTRVEISKKALRFGLEQIDDEGLNRIVEHIKVGKTVLMNGDICEDIDNETVF